MSQGAIENGDEEKLISRCKEGDLESFEPLVKQYQGRLGQVAFQVVRDERLAQEAVQTTFVKAWQKISSFRGQCSFGTWLHRLCVNTCCDLLRERSRRREDPLSHTHDEPEQQVRSHEEMISSGKSPAQESLHHETKRRILQALDHLPEEQRIVLILREMQGLDYREIALTVNCTQGTVMSRLFHARRKLRELLEKRSDFFQRNK